MNTYIVQRGDTLYGISKKYNTSVQSIKELNNLKSDKLDIGQKLFLSENNDTNPIECITYIVKKGDTLYSIAKKYNTTVDSIKRFNNMKNSLIDVGDRIIIPCNETQDYVPGSYVSYIVQKGDSLYSIANKFGTTVDKIRKDNDLSSSTINVGEVLIIDDKKGVSSVMECYGNDTSISKDKTYIVQKGESLYSIAKKNNTTVDEIKRKNNLSSNLISIGQKLLL